MKKKFVMIFVMILFSLSVIGGSVLLVCDNLKENSYKDRHGDSHFSENTEGYWTDYKSEEYEPTDDDQTGDLVQDIIAGKGYSRDNPVMIKTAENLAWLADAFNRGYEDSYDETVNGEDITFSFAENGSALCFKLANDIDLSAHFWVPIGLTHPFNGNFDGGGFRISGMYCYSYAGSDEDETYYKYLVYDDDSIYMGLFGRCLYDNDDYAIRNLVLLDPHISCFSLFNYSPANNLYCGAVVAYSEVDIIRCAMIGGGITYELTEGPTSLYIGCISGYISSITMKQCFVKNFGIICDNFYSGGGLWPYEDLMRMIYGGITREFSSCYGGLVGCALGSSLMDCYVYRGWIAGVFAYGLGGLVGWADDSDISHCYVDLTDEEWSGLYAFCFYGVGGLVGLSSSTIYFSFVNYCKQYLIRAYYGYFSELEGVDTYHGYILGYQGASDFSNLAVPLVCSSLSVIDIMDYYQQPTRDDFITYNEFDYYNAPYIGSLGICYGVVDEDIIYVYEDITEPGREDSNFYMVFYDGGYWNLDSYGNHQDWYLNDFEWEESYANDESFPTWDWGLDDYNGFPILAWSIHSYQVLAKYSQGGDVYFSAYNDNTITCSIGNNSDTFLVEASTPRSGYKFMGFAVADEDGKYSTPTDNTVTSRRFTVNELDRGVCGFYQTTLKKKIYCRALNYTGNQIVSIDETSITFKARSSASGGIPSALNNSKTDYEVVDDYKEFYLHELVYFSASMNINGTIAGWETSSTPLTVGSTLSNYYATTSMSKSVLPNNTNDVYLYAIYTTSSVSFNLAGSYVSENGTTYTNSTSTSAPCGYITTSSDEYYSGSQSFSIGTSITFTADAGNYYTFEGWYYNSSNSMSGATLLGTNTRLTYTLSGSSPFIGKYVFAKFKRKTVSVTVEVMTATGTSYEQSTKGGTPTIKYYNSSNTQTTHTFSTSGSVTFTALAGKNLIVSAQGAKDGYVYMGITTRSTGPYNSTVSPATSLTLGSSNETYYIYYVPNSANLKYDATEKYYYFEDGYMPQTYAEMISSGLNATITSNGTKLGTYTLENGTSYQLSSYNGYYYLGFEATSSTTLKLKSYTTSGAYSFTSGTIYWFRFEPIRWRITDYGTTSVPTEWNSIGAFKKNFTVVSDLVLWYDCMDTNENHKEGDKAYDMTFTSSLRSGKFATMMTKFASQYTSGKLQYSGTNSAEYQQYGPTGQQEIVVVDKTNTSSSYSLTNTYNYTTGGTSSLRVASTEEISDTVGNTKAKASCLVAFLMGATNENYCKYWTRDLDNLNAGKTVTDAGLVKDEWLIYSNGIRFAYTLSDGMNVNIG